MQPDTSSRTACVWLNKSRADAGTYLGPQSLRRYVRIPLACNNPSCLLQKICWLLQGGSFVSEEPHSGQQRCIRAVQWAVSCHGDASCSADLDRLWRMMNHLKYCEVVSSHISHPICSPRLHSLCFQLFLFPSLISMPAQKYHAQPLCHDSGPSQTRMEPVLSCRQPGGLLYKSSS